MVKVSFLKFFHGLIAYKCHLLYKDSALWQWQADLSEN